jgi:hypothetical protein
MNKSAAKGIPNKAVSFSKACKFSFPAKQVNTRVCIMIHFTVDRQSKKVPTTRFEERSNAPVLAQRSIDKEEFSVEKANTEFLSNQETIIAHVSPQNHLKKSAITEPNVASK